MDFEGAAGSDFFAGVEPLPDSDDDPDDAPEEESEVLESDFEGAAGSDVLDAERLSLR
ncbi:hypothetical protein GCM10027020_27540 [Nocardioides salsibiostraticola]